MIENIHLYSSIHIEQTFVFQQSITIRHACNIVRNKTRTVCVFSGMLGKLPFLRQTAWFSHKDFKKVSYHATRLASHSVELVVPIHSIEKEGF